MADRSPHVLTLRALSFLAFAVLISVIPTAKTGKPIIAVLLAAIGLLFTTWFLLEWDKNSAYGAWTATRQRALKLLLILFSGSVLIALYAAIFEQPVRVTTAGRYIVEKLFFVFNKIQLVLDLPDWMPRHSWAVAVEALFCLLFLALLFWIFRLKVTHRRLLVFFFLILSGMVLGLLSPSAEFQISSSARAAQMVFHVASDPAGNFVVVWQSRAENSSDWGIYARRYGVDGSPLSDEFRVNTFIPDNHFVPRVASDQVGNFAIVWESKVQDGSSYGIYCQRYNSEGIAQGGEFQVNTTTAESQHDPWIAMAANGDFIVAWVSDHTTFSGIWGQRFDVGGNKVGGEFQINTLSAGNQKKPSIASDRNGNFVIGWHSEGLDGRGKSVFVHRYDNSGAPLGDEFQVNTYDAGEMQDVWVNMNPNGELVVVWGSDGQDGSGSGIYGRRYDASGNALSDEFQINTFVAGDQKEPSASSDLDGNLVVAWESDGQDGSGKGAYARRYDASGKPLGDEFQINIYSTDLQLAPIVKYNSDGSLIAAWTSFGQDGFTEGVYGRIFR